MMIRSRVTATLAALILAMTAQTAWAETGDVDVESVGGDGSATSDTGSLMAVGSLAVVGGMAWAAATGVAPFPFPLPLPLLPGAPAPAPAPFVSVPTGPVDLPLDNPTYCSLPTNSRFQTLIVDGDAQCRYAYEAISQLSARTERELYENPVHVRVWSPRMQAEVTLRCNNGNPNACIGYPDGQIGFLFKNSGY